MYTLTAFGKKYQMNGSTFAIVFLTCVSLGLLFLWSLFGGMWRFGNDFLYSGWFVIIPMCIANGSITVNGTKYEVNKPKWVSDVSRVCGMLFIMYYAYSVFIK